ncbi:hypothetical protein BKA70DRAFT_1278584, partial [Coprinopsis sp. MPI-PUGE-AT-0042]
MCMDEGHHVRQEVQIWSVAIEYDSNWDAVGLTATLLSTFPEDPRRQILHCSLHGDYVAFGWQEIIYVVNWREANGTSAQFPRRIFNFCGHGEFYVVSARWFFAHFRGTSKIWDMHSAPITQKSISFEASQRRASCVWSDTSDTVTLPQPWLQRFSRPGHDIFIIPKRNQHEALM